MVIGGLTVFLVAKAPESPIIGAATLLFLFAGYTVGRVTALGRVRWYLETFLLTFTVFLLMVPTVSEILRRVPDGHPIATDPSLTVSVGVKHAPSATRDHLANDPGRSQQVAKESSRSVRLPWVPGIKPEDTP